MKKVITYGQAIVRIGIIGTGRIAPRFFKETSFVSGIEVVAAYNPEVESARAFGEEFQIKVWTDSFEAFLAETDAVYVASPNETHSDYVRRALMAGKHVLCEKPMTLRKSEAEAALRMADERNLVLMEGIKTAYAPGYQRLMEVADSGVIGEIRYVDACFTKLEAPDKRELTDRRYGGSFTELASYVLLPVAELLGTAATDIRFSSLEDEATGLDLFTRAELRYPEALASLTCGLGVKSEGRLLIGGTKGYITVAAPWWKPGHIEVHFEDPSRTIAYDEEFEGDGLSYRAVRRIGQAHVYTKQPDTLRARGGRLAVLDRIYVFPCNAQHILSIDAGGYSIRRIELKQELDRDGAFMGVTYLIDEPEIFYLIPNRYPALIRFDAGTEEVRTLLTFDLGTKEIAQVPVSFDRDEIYSLAPGFCKISQWMPYCCCEDVFDPLSDIAAGRIHGAEYDRSMQLSAYESINDSPDGDCGEKVYSFMKERLSA